MGKGALPTGKAAQTQNTAPAFPKEQPTEARGSSTAPLSSRPTAQLERSSPETAKPGSQPLPREFPHVHLISAQQRHRLNSFHQPPCAFPRAPGGDGGSSRRPARAEVRAGPGRGQGAPCQTLSSPQGRGGQSSSASRQPGTTRATQIPQRDPDPLDQQLSRSPLAPVRPHVSPPAPVRPRVSPPAPVRPRVSPPAPVRPHVLLLLAVPPVRAAGQLPLRAGESEPSRRNRAAKCAASAGWAAEERATSPAASQPSCSPSSRQHPGKGDTQPRKKCFG